MRSSAAIILNCPPRLQIFPPNPSLALAAQQRSNKTVSFSSFLGGLSFRRVSTKMGGDASSYAGSSGGNVSGFCTLMEHVGKGGLNVGDDLVVLFGHLEYACKRIAALVASPFSSSLTNNVGIATAGAASSASDRDKPKPLDIVANEIILSSLRSSGKVAVMASEEDDLPVWLTDDGPFVLVTDPLDGSRNIDASIPTGTIFGVYKRLVELDHLPVEEKAIKPIRLKANGDRTGACKFFSKVGSVIGADIPVPTPVGGVAVQTADLAARREAPAATIVAGRGPSSVAATAALLGLRPSASGVVGE